MKDIALLINDSLIDINYKVNEFYIEKYINKFSFNNKEELIYNLYNNLIDFYKKYNVLLAYNKQIQRDMNDNKLVVELLLITVFIIDNINITSNEIFTKLDLESLLFYYLVFVNNSIADLDDSSINNYKYYVIDILFSSLNSENGKQQINEYKLSQKFISYIFQYIKKSYKIQNLYLGLLYNLFFFYKHTTLTTKHYIHMLDIIDSVELNPVEINSDIYNKNIKHIQSITDWINIIISLFVNSTDTCNKTLNINNLQSLYFKSITDACNLILNNIVDLTDKKNVSYIEDNSKYLKNDTLIDNILYSIAIENNNDAIRLNHYLIILLEYLRDVLDIQKNDNIKCFYNLAITEEFAIIIIKLLALIVNNLEYCIIYLKSNEYNLRLYYSYSNASINNNENEYVKQTFKIFMLLSDIIGIIMTESLLVNKLIAINTKTESYNNKNNYSWMAFIKYYLNEEKYICNKIVYKLINILQISDIYYDNEYNRKKGHKQNNKDTESNYINDIDTKDIMYTFQTNIMKTLCNISNKNSLIKKYFEKNKELFYYLLNHMCMDLCNPCKKEWCVLLVKTLTEDNLNIQNMINQLQPCKIDPLVKDYLLKKGYDIKIDKGFLKPNVKKIEFNDI